MNIRLFTGPKVTVNERVYAGLTRTEEVVVDHYLPMHSGDRLTDENIARAEHAAAKIPFIRFHPPLLVRPRPGYNEVDVEFTMSELKQVHLFGGGGVIPGNDGGLVWNLDLSLRNLFGRGRSLEVLSERREQSRNNLNIEFIQPLFLLGIGEWRLRVGSRDYRNDFSEFSLDSKLRVQFRESFAGGLALGWKRVEPTGFESGYSRYIAGFELSRSTVNQRRNPRSGLDLEASIAFAYRRYSSDTLITRPEGEVFTETRSRIALRQYQPLSGPFLALFAISYYGFETDEQLPPLSELYLIGGPGTLRGYRNEQFVAQRTAFGIIEPRVRFSDGFAFLFLDGAYLNSPFLSMTGNIATKELFQYSFGTGLALTGGTRSLKLSFGWNPDSSFDQPRLSIEFSSDL